MPDRSNCNRRKARQPLVLGVLSVLVLVLFWIDLNAGYRTVSLGELLSLLTPNADPALKLTIVTFRLPRILMAALVGIGLASSGCLLQGITRNELADPGVLGINAGAGLMVALFVTAFERGLYGSSVGIPLAAFFGSVITAALVYALSQDKAAAPSPSRLVLTGIAIASALSAVTVMLLLRMRQDEHGFISGWLAGNIWGANWDNIRLVSPWIVALLSVSLYKSNTLNVIGLGPQTATGLGMNIRHENLMLLAMASGLSSVCVAVGGGISFVGLICPHIVRKLIGSRHQLLIPGSALCGAALMLLSDLVGRTLIAPGEIPVGVVATVIGTPYFLYLLINKKRS